MRLPPLLRIDRWIRAPRWCRLPFVGPVIGLGLIAHTALADPALEYENVIRPLLDRSCYDCHYDGETKGDLDLERFSSFDKVTMEPELWTYVFDRVWSREMPPSKKEPLTVTERNTLLDWLRTLPKPESVDCNRIASERASRFYRGFVLSRRLNRDEYVNTVRDLFGTAIELPFAEILPKDGGGGEGFDTTGDALFLSSIHIERYLDAAERIARIILPDDPRTMSAPLGAARERLLIPRRGRFDRAEDAARAVLAPLARQAWRRPVADEEVDRLVALFARGRERGEGFDTSLRLALQAVLISPHFLSLVEPEPVKGGVQRLASIPLASKLSYFIWSSAPDDELLLLAERDLLADPEVYRSQVRRMIIDPRTQAMGSRFALQWLELERLGEEVNPDPATFPEFDHELATAMKTEATLFFNRVMQENRPLLELLDSNYSFVNERLARLYGIDGVTGPEFREVRFTNAERGGVTGMAAVHAVSSYPLRTSPVLRGRWVLEALLGDKIPPPPPEVPALDETAMVTAGLSLRQQLEQHRMNADCAGCHDKMDPLGFGLENFDPLGRWRTEDHGQPLDTTGTLPSGETYTGPDGLRRVLVAQKDKILRHLARKMAGFAFGRELNRYDQCVINDALQALEHDGYRAQVLVESIATSFPFLHRHYLPTEPVDTPSPPSP